MKRDSAAKHVLNPNNWANSYTSLLRNFAKLRISDDFVIQELIQETFLAGLKSMDNFKGRAKESTWLIAILRNKIVDYYRSKNSYKGEKMRNSIRTEDYFTAYNKELTRDTPDENDTYNLINSKELSDIIERSFCLLTKKEGAALQLKLKGYNTEDICSTLHIDPTNCWVILHRGRRKIRNHINNCWSQTL